MQRGDAHAAEELYDRLAHKVFGFSMNRLRDKAAAEDVSQEIFLKLVDRIETFDQARGTFSSWFWQLARNTVTDFYRARREVAFSDTGEAVIEERAGSVEMAPESGWQLKELFGFMKTLSSDEQELFELRFVADLSYREIARMLGKNEGALRVAASRLKDKVRRRLE